MLRGVNGAGGGAPVGGTGTTNTIPRWTGVSTLGDSIISQDVANSRIGINTAAPVRTLHVVATTAASPARLQNTVGAFELGFDASGAYFQPNTANTGVWLYTQAGSFFGISGAAGTQGNVGIGTATPVGRADVAGTSVNQSGWGLLSVQSNDAQGADKGGSITFGGVYDASTATHWAQISGRKENGTSGQYGGYLAFATRTNGAGTNTERARIDSSGNLILNTANTGATIQAAGSQQGLKLPATPGNADSQTLDAYSEGTLTSGFTLSGITTSAGNVNYTARWTRIGRTIVFALRFYPDAGASLTFASGWNVTLTGVPQFPWPVSCATTTDDGTLGRASVHINQSATPIAYGGGTGAYALGANISLYINGTAN